MNVQSYIVQPSATLRGELTVPGDKSISHRALMLGGIAQGRSSVSGFLESEDCLATMGALREMGVEIVRPAAGEVGIRGVGSKGLKAPTRSLDMGNSGTAMRLLAGLLAGQPFESVLVGDESLMKRPMERVAVPLRQMGAQVITTNGLPPVRVSCGPRGLHAMHYHMPVASAQVKSAVLLAGLYAKGVTSVTEPAVTRDHTERMLQGFGVEVHVRHATAQISGPASMRGTHVEVPGDFSSAAFFLVAGCLAAKDGLLLRRVGINPTRIGLLEILRRMGARIRVINERMSGAEPVADLEVARSELRGIDVPAELVPLAIDEFPVLFVAAACAQGVTRVTGAQELRLKESDRIAAMAAGLTALGVRTEVLPDGLVVHGGKIQGGQIDSRGDHRIAMSFAMASLRASAAIHISDVANVATSFPGFVETALNVGLPIERI